MERILQPQELEVFYIIPAIRRGMAVYMKESGMKQKEISRVLGLRDSTVSQYINSKRAAQVKFNKDVGGLIKDSIRRIKSNFDVVRETQNILRVIASSGELCRLHKIFSEVPSSCNIKEIGCTA